MLNKIKFNHKNNWWVNNKIDWLIILFLILFIQIIVYQSQFFGICIGIIIIYVVYSRQSNLKTKMFGTLLMSISLFVSVFNKSSKIDIFDQIDSLLKFSIYDETINFINKNQSTQSADFILLILFNIKQNEGIFFSIL